jgi:hypothetical protein
MKAESSWGIFLDAIRERQEITREVLFNYAVKDERPEVVMLRNQYTILIVLRELLCEKATKDKES